MLCPCKACCYVNFMFAGLCHWYAFCFFILTELACCAGQPMAAVQAEDLLAAAEAGTAGSSAAEQKASIKNALNTPTDPEDIIISVSCLMTAHYASLQDCSCCEQGVCPTCTSCFSP